MYRALEDRPLFRLHGLEPGREYSIVVYAENAKGRSDPPVVLRNIRVEIEGSPETLQENGRFPKRNA